MGIKTWLWNAMNPKGAKIDITQDYCARLTTSVFYKQLAFWACVRIVSNAISRVRWRTFVHGDEELRDDYYKLNLRPNRNQNSSEFYRELIGKLFSRNEVLVIVDPIEGHWMIADDYTKHVRGVADTYFTDVVVNEFEFMKTFFMSEVFFLELANEDIKRLLDSVYTDYAELLEISRRSYRTLRGRKGVINIDAFRGGTAEEQQAEIDMVAKNFRKMFESENGFTLLEKGKSYQDLSSSTQRTESTRDIQAVVEDIYALYAKAFGIPVVILQGQVAGLEDAVNYLVQFGIEPIVDLIRTEWTTKLYGKAGFMAGSELRADTSRIKSMSLKEMGAHGDKLVSSGIYSVNELRIKMDEPLIDEDWADKHWMTLNYQRAEQEAMDEKIQESVASD